MEVRRTLLDLRNSCGIFSDFYNDVVSNRGLWYRSTLDWETIDSLCFLLCATVLRDELFPELLTSNGNVRLNRIGQRKSVTYVDLVAPKTVDEKIKKALRKKINIASEIMGEELRDWI